MKFDAKKTIAALAMSATLFAMPVSALAENATVAGAATPAGYTVLNKTWTDTPTADHAVSSIYYYLTYNGVTNDLDGFPAKVMQGDNELTDGHTFMYAQQAGTGKNAPEGSVTAADVFDGIEFTAPGDYSFTLAEQPSPNGNYAYNTNNASYTVTVQVVWAEGTLDTPVVSDVVVKSDAGDGAKGTAQFNNDAKDGASLSLTKKVAGNSADTAKKFDFTVSFTGLVSGATYSYADASGATQTFVASGNGTADVSVALKHDQNVTFTNLTEGAKYTIAEGGTTLDNDKQAVTVNGYVVTMDGADGTAEKGMDTVVVTNTKSATTITGLMVTFLPYIGGLAVAGAGAGALVISRRRKHDADNF